MVIFWSILLKFLKMKIWWRFLIVLCVLRDLVCGIWYACSVHTIEHYLRYNEFQIIPRKIDIENQIFFHSINDVLMFLPCLTKLHSCDSSFFFYIKTRIMLVNNGKLYYQSIVGQMQVFSNFKLFKFYQMLLKVSG